MVYRAGFTYYDFQEETIFNKTVDRIPSQSLTVAASFTKDWGQLSTGVEVASFLNDFERNHLFFWCNFDVRIFKGLSANSWMSYSIQRDQVNIRLNGASQEEVLLQQQQLLSGFEMNAFVGLSYRFGSIYNNVVNPRFN
jgi:DNA-binding PucR family transcriptional regulator